MFLKEVKFYRFSSVLLFVIIYSMRYRPNMVGTSIKRYVSCCVYKKNTKFRKQPCTHNTFLYIHTYSTCVVVLSSPFYNLFTYFFYYCKFSTILGVSKPFAVSREQKRIIIEKDQSVCSRLNNVFET